jgi:hypothetical protein
MLRERYARTIPVLAPPFGLFDERTVRIGREEGLAPCLTVEPAVLDGRRSRDTMPRIGLTGRHQPWKAALSAVGYWPESRPRRRRSSPYPDLPSETT